MACGFNEPYYIPPSKVGLNYAKNNCDGYSITLVFTPAYPETNFSLGYNIYYSSDQYSVFEEGVKFVSTNLDGLTAEILDLSPGETYFFAVRATEWLDQWYNINFLPNYETSGVKIYPETLLMTDISDIDTLIALDDVSQLPPYGVLKIGGEFVRYGAVDISNSSIIVTERGFRGTQPREHMTDGYDGVKYWSPVVTFFKGCEEQNQFIVQETANFHYPCFPKTDDGYKIKEDLLLTNMDASDEERIDFLPMDYAGWHRTDPKMLFDGTCLDTYIGGEIGCADGYSGRVQVKGITIPLENRSDRTEEAQLELTGEPVVLFKRLWKGIVCACYEPNKESPESRCPFCFGTGIAGGYEQYHNPRRKDGRILVRFDQTTDDLIPTDYGLEADFKPNCWTLVVPTLHDRDFLVRFNIDGTQEFRYEVLNVMRNKLLFSQSGGQKFQVQRIRKTDRIYQVRSIYDTSPEPTTYITTVGFTPGAGGIPPHTHTISTPVSYMNPAQINGTTSESEGHTHQIYNGIVQDEGLGHIHNIIMP